MCVGIPAKVIKINGKKATVRQGGHLHCIDLSFVSESVVIGDYLLVHQNVAINKISKKEAQQILKLTAGLGIDKRDRQRGSSLSPLAQDKN